MKNIRFKNSTATLLGLSLFAVAALQGSAATLLKDDFSDGNRISAPNGGNWYSFAGTGLSVTPEGLMLTDTAGTKAQRAAEVHFDAAKLAVNETLTVRVSIKPEGSNEGTANVRIGLYDSKGTALTRDSVSGVTSESYIPRVGYFALLDTRAAGTGTVDFRNTTSAQKMFSIVEGNSVGSVYALHKFKPEWAAIEWKITRQKETEYSLSMSVNGERAKTVLHRSGAGEQTDTLDTFMIFSNNGAEFTINHLEIETATAE